MTREHKFNLINPVAITWYLSRVINMYYVFNYLNTTHPIIDLYKIKHLKRLDVLKTKCLIIDKNTYTYFYWRQG